jgi:hypothetical protein
VSTASDRRFIDWFMRAVGVLAGFAATMVFLAGFMARGAHGARNDPMDARAIEERIAPITRVAVSGGGIGAPGGMSSSAR